MGLIKTAIPQETTSWVEVPGIEGFTVHLRFLSREELVKIRNKSMTTKFSKKTRQREDELDSSKFLEEYSARAILDWKGLTFGHLPSLFPVDISAMDAKKAIPYSQEEALDLLENSAIFDQFVTDIMSDYEEFSITKKEEEIKN